MPMHNNELINKAVELTVAAINADSSKNGVYKEHADIVCSYLETVYKKLKELNV